MLRLDLENLEEFINRMEQSGDVNNAGITEELLTWQTIAKVY